MRKTLDRVLAALAVALSVLLAAQVVAVLSYIGGSVLAVIGVYILFGTGWAFIAASVPLLALTVTLIRGLRE